MAFGDTIHNYWVSRLTLTNYRNYEQLTLELTNDPVVLIGCNGVGKTNILEAISLLAPGKGMRSSKLDDFYCQNAFSPQWGVHAHTQYGDSSYTIGTGVENVSAKSKRQFFIDGEKIAAQSELLDAFNVTWLTPQMDGLFLSGRSERRKFLDRLVYNFDSEHASRVYSYEHTLRERSKLLQSPHADHTWLSTLEQKIAEKAVAIIHTRLEVIRMVGDAIESGNSVFPKATIWCEGKIEELVLAGGKALEIEQEVARILCESRVIDRELGRTHIGAHRSDFCVKYTDKNMMAASCSTGEQKALLVSIILGEVRAKARWRNSVPVLLFDELTVHLDKDRRHSLYQELTEIGAQLWLTGTDKDLFDYVGSNAQFIFLDNGKVQKLA